MYEYTRDAKYAEWLKNRERDAEKFGVPVDNSRPNIINIAMVDLLSGRPSYFGLGKIEDDEAALWMSKNIPTLFYTIHYKADLIDILETEIRRAEANIDGKSRISIEKMREMIEILKNQPRPVPVPAAAPVSKQTPAAAPVSKQTPAAAPVSKQTPAAAPRPNLRSKLAVIEEGDEDDEDDEGDADVSVSAQIPAAAPASEPLGKEEAARTLNALVLKHVNGFLLRNEALDHIFNLSSEQPPAKKREIVEKLTKLMKEHVNDDALKMRAMHCISILKGNEGGYRQRTKHSKKSQKTKSRKTKSRKTKSRKTKSRRH